MRIKNQEWINFKKTIISFVKTFEEESIHFDYPIEDEEDFKMLVEDCIVNPIFTKKEDFLKVEYDFTFCVTKIRTLSFSKYKDSARFEITLKDRK
jgi:hypothetical protein